MSKYKVGDKVRTIKDRDCKIGIITDIVEDVSFPYQVRVGDADNYYYSEDMLAPYVEKTYEDGLADAWKLHMMCLEMPRPKLCKILGIEICTLGELFESIEPQQALAKLEAYEKSKQIQVGDVVYEFDKEEYGYGVVTDLCDDECCILWDEGYCNKMEIENLVKTGRHIDIEHLLEQIRGNE